MPTTTAPSPPRLPPPSADRPRLIAAAAAYAAAELLLTVAVGRFFEWGRAEALLFFAFRPWLLLAAALITARYEWRSRLLFYALALLLAAASETLLVLALGARSPWVETLRGLAAGALLLVPMDVAVQLGRRWGRVGLVAAAAALAALLLVPGVLRPHEALLLPARAAQSAEKPVLMMMTGLPIVWGEAGPFDPNSRPAEAYETLQEEYRVELLDTLERRTLAAGRLLLLAQPQRLSPAELAAVDDWVRRGGRAMILADPALLWPSELPLGDIRRPPPVSLLGPLLDHWGLALEPPARPERVVASLGKGRLTLEAAGRFRRRSGGCSVGPEVWLARCRPGVGEAALIADADLMRDDLWAPRGGERHLRTADNPLILADLLDSLAGIERRRAAGEVAWADPAADRRFALLLALLPIVAAAGTGLLLSRRRRV